MSQLESNSELEKFGQETVENIAEKIQDTRVEVFKSVEKGSPYRKILEHSRENEIDVIVMSTHGRTGLDRMLLGSVTEKVLRKSDIPVLTVPRD